MSTWTTVLIVGVIVVIAVVALALARSRARRNSSSGIGLPPIGALSGDGPDQQTDREIAAPDHRSR